MKAYVMESRAGTPEEETFYESMMLLFQTVRPFIQKWGSANQDYDAIYQQALCEMRQPDFRSTGSILTAWGNKPQPKSQQLQQ
jgi:hypothetical protein